MFLTVLLQEVFTLCVGLKALQFKHSELNRLFLSPPQKFFYQIGIFVLEN
jgi:hypothetical protein